MTLEEIDSLVEQIERFYKKRHYDICPSCNKETKVVPNPFYMHICNVCGWEGNYCDCKTVWPHNLVKELLESKLL